MKIEPLVSQMLSMNINGRLWHWMTDSAQHHVTYEQFLTQNEQFTDSFVESCLGNDLPLQLHSVGVENAQVSDYTLSEATSIIKEYRGNVIEFKAELASSEKPYGDELITILDDVVELCSKTLYLLKLK